MSVEILLQSLISTCAALHFDTKYKPIFFLINSGYEKEDIKDFVSIVLWATIMAMS